MCAVQGQAGGDLRIFAVSASHDVVGSQLRGGIPRVCIWAYWSPQWGCWNPGNGHPPVPKLAALGSFHLRNAKKVTGTSGDAELENLN